MFLTQDQIREAVSDPTWQTMRNSLHGVPTQEKLDKLVAWIEQASEADRELHEIQVQNYLNALARGGAIGPTMKRLSVVDQCKQAVLKGGRKL